MCQVTGVTDKIDPTVHSVVTELDHCSQATLWRCSHPIGQKKTHSQGGRWEERFCPSRERYPQSCGHTGAHTQWLLLDSCRNSCRANAGSGTHSQQPRGCGVFSGCGVGDFTRGVGSGDGPDPSVVYDPASSFLLL